ncbi:multidrug efflux pump subunit AcrA (membrane-fusion protein) [Dysgonomonas alginatilytica]|uniref:Multidrug efflux pump subunit AcrA (Membrane-fusion protein) n=1 Tax=Dysgonomonas alginatilytica TaxID=1605892 RepID=A0A2V3PK40_9BACT|nr:efflux RND transporter periplasmic adaptor subunit [Dysgonomonas alginatilytica]PXV58954.1 multidrug efflux pump subunit AcrA (membrane-fusion protein) [Dysgonomonas alginatilytica]
MDTAIKKKHPILRYKYYIISGIILIGLFTYSLFSEIGSKKLRIDSTSIQISEVLQDKFLDYLEVEGIAQPRLTVKLNSSENGIVKHIIADEGSMLVQGDTILILDNPQLIRSIQDERDELEKQQITYEEKLIQMKRKSSELKRTALKTVYESDRLSKQYNLDKEEYQIGIKSKAQLEVAADDYSFNQKNASILLEELKHDSLMNILQTDLMKNDLNRENKKFINSKDRLNNLIIKAPVSGQLSYISVIPGEQVLSGNSIGELKVVEDLKISTKISEYYIDRVSVGLPASITYQDKKIPLKITKINPEIKDRQFEVDLIFMEEKPDNIRIGKNYRIQIELGQPEEALVISKGNFYQETGGQWLFKLNKAGDRATKADISLGRQNPLQYEILNGLKAGDKVIITGYDNFSNVQEIILK